MSDEEMNEEVEAESAETEPVEVEAAPAEVDDSLRYPSVPEEPDPPSYAPIFSGLGIATFAWGFLTNPSILLMGLAIFVFGLSIWIKELTK